MHEHIRSSKKIVANSALHLLPLARSAAALGTVGAILAAEAPDVADGLAGLGLLPVVEAVAPPPVVVHPDGERDHEEQEEEGEGQEQHDEQGQEEEQDEPDAQ